MRVLGLVPARGGSKGVPGKNIKLLGGKPLLHYTAAAALAAQTLERVVLSTEDPAIAEVGGACGLSVPFRRPSELAADTTPTLPVVQHALRWFSDRGDHFDAVCILQPTSPLRSASLIDCCVQRLEASGADAVATVRLVPAEYNPQWVFWEDAVGELRLASGKRSPITRRQDLPPAYYRDGAVYVTRSETVLGGNSLYGAHLVGFLNEEPSINIDTLEDWARAEAAICADSRDDERRD